MTQVVIYKWAKDISGAYTTGGDWTPSGVPENTSAFDNSVFIGGTRTVGTAAFMVTSAANQTIGFLEIGADATFAITAGVFAIDAFLSSDSRLFNYGAVTVGGGATLSFGDGGGTTSLYSGLWNTGSLTLSGAMQLNAPVFDLFGPGTVTLSGGKIIGASAAGTEFINKSGAIVGSGAIGQGDDLTFVNAQNGVVDANSAAALTLDTGANTITNSGTIETTGTGGLDVLSDMQLDGQLLATGAGALLLSDAYAHGGGVLAVATGAETVLKTGEIDVGVVSIASGGEMTTTYGDLAAVGVNNAFAGDLIDSGDISDDGKLVVAAHSLLNLNATILGAGEVDLNAASFSATLEVFSNGLSLFQTGGVVMSNSVLNKIVSEGAGAQISNSSKISGAGVIGDGFLRLFNSIAGSVVSTGSARLTIDADAKAVAAGSESEDFNAGTISSTGAGGLTIAAGTLSNAGYLTEDGAGSLLLSALAVDSGGGFVQVQSGSLTLAGNSSITHQTGIDIAAAGVLTTTTGDTADTIYANVTNSGRLSVAAKSTLLADGHWTNNKAIVVGATTGAATISIAAASSLQLLGVGGSVQLANAADRIVSAGAGANLENKTNLIYGAGAIGDANMAVNNEFGGVIDATLAGGLTLNAQAETSGSTYLYNAGTIKADSAAGVTITAGMYNAGKLIVDAGSKIVAKSDVYGAGTATINGAASIEFAAVAQGSVYFGATAGGSLILDKSTEDTGEIFGLKAGDSFDLRDFKFVSGMTGIDVTQSFYGDLASSLVLVNGTSSSAAISLEGNFSLATLTAEHLALQVTSDKAASGGTLVSLVKTA